MGTDCRTYSSRASAYRVAVPRPIDPAAGTGTFLVEAARLAAEEIVGKYREEAGKIFLPYYLANNPYVFENMMVPYAVTCLKMANLLDTMGGGRHCRLTGGLPIHGG